MDLLKFPGVPAAGGVSTCNLGLILEHRDTARGMHRPSTGLSLEAKGTSHPPVPCPWVSIPISHLGTPTGAVCSPPADPGILCAAGTHRKWIIWRKMNILLHCSVSTSSFPLTQSYFYLCWTPNPRDPLIHKLGHFCSAFQWNIENIETWGVIEMIDFCHR